jgi:predicted helicase
MNLNMQHNFPLVCYDWDSLFENFDDPDKAKLWVWKKRLVEQSEQNPDQWEPYKYRGEGFEAFVEAFVKLMGTHPNIGITDYSPVPGDQDYGVDGLGTGANGKPAAVQAKFRSNTSSKLTSEDHISNFVSNAVLEHDVPKELPESDKFRNFLIVTTAEGTHYEIENNMYVNKVRTLGYDELKRFVDHNLAFWQKFKQLGDELISANTSNQ